MNIANLNIKPYESSEVGWKSAVYAGDKLIGFLSDDGVLYPHSTERVLLSQIVGRWVHPETGELDPLMQEAVDLIDYNVVAFDTE